MDLEGRAVDLTADLGTQGYLTCGPDAALPVTEMLLAALSEAHAEGRRAGIEEARQVAMSGEYDGSWRARRAIAADLAALAEKPHGT